MKSDEEIQADMLKHYSQAARSALRRGDSIEKKMDALYYKNAEVRRFVIYRRLLDEARANHDHQLQNIGWSVMEAT